MLWHNKRAMLHLQEKQNISVSIKMYSKCLFLFIFNSQTQVMQKPQRTDPSKQRENSNGNSVIATERAILLIVKRYFGKVHQLTDNPHMQQSKEMNSQMIKPPNLE